MPKIKGPRSACPLGRALDLLGDKWTLLVVRDLLFKGKGRFREMLESDEGIATNILADRLKQLVAEGLATKNRDPEDGKSFVYQLTPKGQDLAPVLLEMILWSGRHDPDTVVTPSLHARAKKDRSALLRELQGPQRRS